MYNLKDVQRRQKANDVIEKLKSQHARDQENEIFEDDEGGRGHFNQMRQTKTGGFGAKGYQQEGALEPDEDDSEGEEDDGEDDEGGVDQDEDEDEESDHNF